MKDTLRQIAVVLSFLATLIMNGLAVASGLNGITTAEISHQHETLFTPADYVFSIWSLIYLALTIYVIYQALPSQAHARLQASVGWWFVATNGLNVIWLFTWHYNLWWASIMPMVVLMLCLIAIYVRLHIWPIALISDTQRWLVSRPFSLYIGWISVATIANIAVALQASGWDGFGIAQEVWTIVMSVVAVALGLMLVVRHRDYIFTAVIAWALIGIAVKFI